MSKDRVKTILICSIAILFAFAMKLIPIISYNMGKSSYIKGKYVSAYKSLKRAYFFNKNNKNYRYYYALTLSHLSPSMTIQKEIFMLANSEHNDSASQVASNKVNEWRSNVLQNIGDNYIEQAPMDNGILRWDVAKFPLKVFVGNFSGEDVPEYYLTKVNEALSQWQTSTQIIKFTSVESEKDADLIVKISPLPNDVCNGESCRYVVGFTTPKISGSLLKNMTITLYSKDPNGNFFSDKELYNTILHEIGHALGIMGHSYSSEDLMYMSSDGNSYYTPYRSSFQYLSSKDINTIKLLYKMLPDISNNENISTKGLVYAPIILGTSKDISERKLKEAQHYIKEAPNLAGGYIDLSVAYSELGKPKEAINAMLKANELTKSNDEKYMVNLNLGLLYLSIKDYKKALQYAEIAKSISDTEEVKDLFTQINHARNK